MPENPVFFMIETQGKARILILSVPMLAGFKMSA